MEEPDYGVAEGLASQLLSEHGALPEGQRYISAATDDDSRREVGDAGDCAAPVESEGATASICGFGGDVGGHLLPSRPEGRIPAVVRRNGMIASLWRFDGVERVTADPGISPPMFPPGLPAPVTSASMSWGASCAAVTRAGAWCWGASGLAKGSAEPTVGSSPIDADGITAPARIPGIPRDITMVSISGDSRACAIAVGGSAWCWDMTLTPSPGGGSRRAPLNVRRVPGLDASLADISVGRSLSCAVTVAGRAVCWGKTPPATRIASGVSRITVGRGHACALMRSGQVRCWGRNTGGQLGNGTAVDSDTPVVVTGLGEPAIAVSAGSSHTCALLRSGGVRCWGMRFTMPGSSTDVTDNPYLRPGTPPGVESGARSISAGGDGTCASMARGDVLCWPAPDDVQGPVAPEKIDGMSGVTAVLTAHGDTDGSVSGCATVPAGRLRCWGDRGNVGAQIDPAAISGLLVVIANEPGSNGYDNGYGCRRSGDVCAPTGPLAFWAPLP